MLFDLFWLIKKEDGTTNSSPTLLNTCDGSVRMKSTLVMSL